MKDGDRESGGISAVAPDGGEREVAAGLVKPVGLAASGGYLYVSDQKAGSILRCQLPACARIEPVARVADPDLLAPAPGGAVLAARRSGGVVLVCGDGRTREVAGGTAATRGVAYDPAGRLFYVETGASRPVLRIAPLRLGDKPCAERSAK